MKVRNGENRRPAVGRKPTAASGRFRVGQFVTEWLQFMSVTYVALAFTGNKRNDGSVVT